MTDLPIDPRTGRYIFNVKDWRDPLVIAETQMIVQMARNEERMAEKGGFWYWLFIGRNK